MKHPLKILLIEDSLADVMLLQRVLHKAHVSHILKVVDTESDFNEMLDKFKPDVVLSDHALPSFNSLEALQILRDKELDIPFILVTGTVSEEFAVSCMKAGADDYILKDRLFRLPVSIESVFSRKQLSREKELIESLHIQLKKIFDDLAEKNKSITESIHYAQRIQEAMLPELKSLHKLFPRSFIFNKPKDIIGGDFYWFTEREGLFYIAVADCTGHGVPGALISMLGFNLLNEIVKTKKSLKPGHILEKLHTGIQKVLKQDTYESSASDGMDIAICSIDRTKRKINFSGANRPLFIKNRKGFKIVKGNRSGLGGKENSQSKKYENHHFVYEKGDIIYLCTDGYADQFGGRRSKKLMSRNLNKLLQASHSFDILEQHELLVEWLDKWRGDLEQTDDVLVVGIEL
jgi:sigma-B regulation protein RsbU (phosphoserine phosphatase)